MNKRKIGFKYEKEVANYLKKLGYKILELNFYSRNGEIDIVAEDKDFIVFVEVKSLRKSSSFSIYESLTKQKKKRLNETILDWLELKEAQDSIWRVDFVAVTYTEDEYELEHYKFIDLEN